MHHLLIRKRPVWLCALPMSNSARGNDITLLLLPVKTPHICGTASSWGSLSHFSQALVITEWPSRASVYPQHPREVRHRAVWLRHTQDVINQGQVNQAPARGINQSSALAPVSPQPWTRGSSSFPHPKMLTRSLLCIEWICACWWSFQGENTGFFQSAGEWVTLPGRRDTRLVSPAHKWLTGTDPGTTRPAHRPDSPKGRDFINILFSGGKLCLWQSKAMGIMSVSLALALNSVSGAGCSGTCLKVLLE